MLQISAASLVELAPSSGCTSTHIVFAVLICLCVSAGPHSFHMAGRGGGCRFVADNNGSGKRQRSNVFLQL